jgi:hypothetical protein
MHRQVQDGFTVGPHVDRVDLAYLYSAHFHRGVWVHHQAGAWRYHGHRHTRGEVAPEQADRDGDNKRNHDDGRQTR